MLRAAQSVVIHRPLEEVFAFVTTPENSSKWQSATVETKKITPGAVSVGTRISHVGKFIGRRIEVIGVVTEYEPNRKYSYESHFRSTAYFLRYTFEPAQGGTKLILDTEANLAGTFRLLAPLATRMTQRMYRKDLDKMKEVLEATNDEHHPSLD